MAGETIYIGEGSFIMIHNARASVSQATADEMFKFSETLKQINESMVTTYSARCGRNPDKVRAWMNDETWFSGQDAINSGFADEFIPNMRAVAYSERLECYKNVPKSLKGRSPNRLRALELLEKIRL
jgi:ATP-dependent Clp protease, protease subunit